MLFGGCLTAWQGKEQKMLFSNKCYDYIKNAISVKLATCLSKKPVVYNVEGLVSILFFWDCFIILYCRNVKKKEVNNFFFLILLYPSVYLPFINMLTFVD